MTTVSDGVHQAKYFVLQSVNGRTESRGKKKLNSSDAIGEKGIASVMIVKILGLALQESMWVNTVQV